MGSIPLPIGISKNARITLQRFASTLSKEKYPQWASVTLSDLTASSLASTNSAKLLQSASIGTSLSFSTNTLNTIQGIRTVDSPTFAGLTLTGLSGVLKATIGVIAGSATLDDVADGTSYERVAANQLSSGIYIDATTTVKGIASFDTNDFTVTSGAITVKDSGIDHNQLANYSADRHFLQTGITSISTSLTGTLVASSGTLSAVTPCADNTYANPTSITTVNGVITAIS